MGNKSKSHAEARGCSVKLEHEGNTAVGLEKSADARSPGSHPQKLRLQTVGRRKPGGEKPSGEERSQSLP